MGVVYVAQEANFICSLSNHLDSHLYTSTQKAGNNPHMSMFLWSKKVGSGCTKRALKLENDSATRKNSQSLLGQTLKTLHDHA